MPSDSQPDRAFDEQLAVAIPALPKLDYDDIAAVREVAAAFAGTPPDLTGLTSQYVEVPVAAGAIALSMTAPADGGSLRPLVYSPRIVVHRRALLGPADGSAAADAPAPAA